MQAGPQAQFEPIIIHASRGRLFLLFLSAAGFVAVGCWMLTLPDGKLDLEGRIAAWVGIPFFGLCGGFALWRLIRPGPVLRIDERGITDHSSAVAGGFIAWSEISGASVYSVGNQKILGIELIDPQAFLARTSGLKRLVMRANAKWFKYPVNISAVTLPVTVEELLALVNRRAGAQTWGAEL
jgi:hypothetical protein